MDLLVVASAMVIGDFFLQILSGLIVASIIGASTSFIVLMKCVHKQQQDIKLMKKATIIAFRSIVKDTKEFHGEDMTDIEKLYKELIKSD